MTFQYLKRVVLILACLIGLLPLHLPATPEKLVYMVVWRGCEEACQGFIDYVKDQNLAVTVVVKNVARDKAKLSAIVQEAQVQKADLVVTWGTSVTLGMVGTVEDQTKAGFLTKIPVVFMLVADPVRANIIKSYTATGRTNVTGTRNRVPEATNIKAIQRFARNFKHLGLLYNPQEANSKLKVAELNELATKMQFTFTALPLALLPNGELNMAALNTKLATMKQQGVDFIYLGSSSLLRKNGDLFTRAALDNELPVLSPYEHLVRKSNALLSVAARYSDVGKLAGEQMKAILFGQRQAGNLAIKAVKNYAYVINMQVARELGLYPSVNILQYAETINP